MQHANQRFYLTPDTRELVLQLGRAYGGTFNTSQPQVSLKIKRRKCSATDEFEMQAFALDKDRYAHFEIPTELTTNTQRFPRGFYDAKVFVKGCHVGDIEMVKAPGYYVQDLGVAETDGECDNGLWCEPTCEDDNDHSGCMPVDGDEGGCLYSVKNNCPNCLTTRRVAEVNLVAGYGY